MIFLYFFEWRIGLRIPVRRAFFTQYTNPAGYPPLQHAINILLEAGWIVDTLGVRAPDGAVPLRLSLHSRLTVKMMQRPAPGLLQKLHYALFCVRSSWIVYLRRPALVYASDPMGAPVALMALALGRRNVVYHEHDAPAEANTAFQSFISRLRRSVCRRATSVVVPNQGRANDLTECAGVVHDRIFTVFNCPSQMELTTDSASFKPLDGESDFWLYFHGSIVPDRLPHAVVDALALLPNRVRLRIAGYETEGSVGYTRTLMDRARHLGIADRLESVGAVPDRSALLQYARASHLGLALMPMETDDINMTHMVGASNKPFDYLACGCPLIVSNLPEWIDMYVRNGLARACDPRSPESIVEAVMYWLADEKRYCDAQLEGLRRIKTDWNYETQFAPVLARINENSASVEYR